MSTILEARIPSEQFALHETLEGVPDAEFESIRVSATESERVLLPFLRGSTDVDANLARTLAEDPTTERVEEVASGRNGSLFRLQWTASVRITLKIILEQEATLLDTRAANGTWWFRLLFPKHEYVSSTNEVCEDYGIDIEPQRVYQLDDLQQDECFGITGQQLEAIQVAYESGYYEVPRKVTLKDLASKTEVSHQALSERFRRGHSTLVENVVIQQNI